MSPKSPILCRMGCKTLTQSISGPVDSNRAFEYLQIIII